MARSITSARTLGNELRNWRKARCLTQNMTAQRVGLAQKAISALETHTGESSVARLLQVLSALDLELVLKDKSGNEVSLQQDW